MNIEESPNDYKHFARGSISFQGRPPPRKKRYIIGGLVVLIIVAVIAGLFVLLHHSESHHPDSKRDFYRNSLLREYKNGGGAVCTDGTPCSIIGRNILKKSGSAVDAAIAASFCNGMYTMQSMGIGGGFQMIYYQKSSGRVYNINAREIAPAKATKDMFNKSAELSKTGGLSCGIPGELKGYFEAHQRFGSHLSWKEIIQPSYDLCMRGFALSRHQRNSVYLRFEDVKADPTLRAMFFDTGKDDVKPMGSLIKPPSQFCATLKTLMEQSPDSFYNGALANDFVKDVQDLGGIITEDDLKNYNVKITEAVKVTLSKNDTVYSSPIPGSGVLLGFILKLLDGYKITPSDILTIGKKTNLIQRIVESFKHAFAFRTQLGDVLHEDSEEARTAKEVLNKLSSDDYVNEIRARILVNKTSNDIKDYGNGGKFYNPEDHGTSHLSIIAPNGDAASLTSSVNVFFGAARIGSRTGILLNDGMDDFSNPGYNNYFGLPPSPVNFIAPGKSAISSVTPTIILNNKGDVKMVTGGAGGTKITTSTAYVILRHLWLEENIKVATDAERVHHQLVPMVLEYEQGFSQEVINNLNKIGHETELYTSRGSVVCSISVTNEAIYGNSDYRKDGDVCGFNPYENIVDEQSC